MKLIESKGPQAKAKLKSSAKVISSDQFEQAFQTLLESRRVNEHPAVGKSKTLKYGVQPPDPEPYLKETGQQLVKVVELLLAASVPRDELARVVLQWVNRAGLMLADPLVTATVPTSGASQELDLIMLMRQIEPGAERGALVTARELRRAANLDKAVFDRSVIDLARSGRLMLHRHDHASGLDSHERDELVTDGAGAYYVGMALRRRDG